MAPQLVVLLASLDRHTERRPDDVRLEAGTLGEKPPPALLADQRLADVEEDGFQRHRRSLQCLALEVRQLRADVCTDRLS